MKLREILPPDAEFDERHADIEIGGVTADSRDRQTRRCLRRHRRRQGRRAALCRRGDRRRRRRDRRRAARRDPPLPENVAFVRVGNARRALALMAAKFYPRQPSVIAAVTGTSGKTSVAAFTRQIWSALGHRAASIGTIGIVSPRGETYGSLTTPDPVALHRSLDALAGDGVTHLGHRGILARPRPISARRLAYRRRRLHQYHARSSRLSSELRGLSRRQAAAVRRLARAGRGRGHRRRSRAMPIAVIAAAQARGLRIMTSAARAPESGLLKRRSTALRKGCGSNTTSEVFSGAPAAGRRISDRERAGRRRACHRDRRRCRLGICGARTSDRRQRPARARRHEPRRADLRRLCA